MSKQIPHEIIDRASEWFIEMREMHISDSKREAFTEWLRSSPAHVQAYLEVAGTWGDAPQVSKEFDVDFAREATNVIALKEEDATYASLTLRALKRREGEGEEARGMQRRGKVGASLPPSRDSAAEEAPASGVSGPSPRAAEGVGASGVSGLSRPRERDVLRAQRKVVALAVSLLLIIATATTWWWQTTRDLYTTDTGEQRVITLDDGSIVRLNSQSKLRVHLTPHQRNIELLEGQAHFQVAKDTTRPFTVHTHDITARAVGTQFDVYRRKTGTTVTVLEGRVAVIAANAVNTSVIPACQESDASQRGTPACPGPTTTAQSAPTSPLHVRGEGRRGEVSLAAGEQITVTLAGAVQLLPQANIAAATGWLQQELIFTGEPLKDVIDEFNRYTRRTIVLDDPTLAQFKINAAFNTTNPQSLLLFLSRMDGVTINETDNEIHITRKNER